MMLPASAGSSSLFAPLVATRWRFGGPKAEQENKQLTVLVNGDKSRPYGEVVSLMASLQEAGLTQVGLLTEPLK